MRSAVASAVLRGPAPFARAAHVHEGTPRYEDEGSVRESRGAVTVAGGAWWSAALSVPVGDTMLAADTVLLRLERHGAGATTALGDASVELLIASGEVDAVVALLAGLVEQARRDAVLAPLVRDPGAHGAMPEE